MATARLYRWDNFDQSAEVVVLLWDADSAKAYVAYSLG